VTVSLGLHYIAHILNEFSPAALLHFCEQKGATPQTSASEINRNGLDWSHQAAIAIGSDPLQNDMQQPKPRKWKLVDGQLRRLIGPSPLTHQHSSAYLVSIPTRPRLHMGP